MAKGVDLKIRPVLLSGGAGSRFWPTSRKHHPRQFQRFGRDRTMLQDTVLRLKAPEFSYPVVMCLNEHRFLVAEQLGDIGQSTIDIMLEAQSLNTASSILTAAIWMHTLDPSELMLVLPCDHFMSDAEAFCQLIVDAADNALQGKIVTFGVEATQPNPEFGYIQPTDPDLLSAAGFSSISRFIDKPDAETAASLIDEGCYWNSGIYLLNPGKIIDEYEKLAPDLLSACHAALMQSKRDLDFLRLADDPMKDIQPQSFNQLIKNTSDIAVIRPLNSGWRNVHSWSAFHQSEASDENGNVLFGDSIIVNSKNSLVQSENALTALIGVENIAAIATEDAILVTDLKSSENIHAIVDKIAASEREHHLVHLTRHQPWGSAKNILSSADFRVNELMVSPGKEISLQRHNHRAEHWVVVEGTARVKCDEEEYLVRENESTYVPAGSLHQLSNPGRIPLRIIEIQSGSYFGPDDIIRSDSISE